MYLIYRVEKGQEDKVAARTYLCYDLRFRPIKEVAESIKMMEQPMLFEREYAENYVNEAMVRDFGRAWYRRAQQKEIELSHTYVMLEI
jgi:hypothetical protein